MSFKLWSINRWLRWTGFRMYIAFSLPGEPDEPTRIGLTWYGLPGSNGWRRIEGTA